MSTVNVLYLASHICTSEFGFSRQAWALRKNGVFYNIVHPDMQFARQRQETITSKGRTEHRYQRLGRQNRMKEKDNEEHLTTCKKKSTGHREFHL